VRNILPLPTYGIGRRLAGILWLVIKAGLLVVVAPEDESNLSPYTPCFLVFTIFR
jgi:hypothetical protein